MGLRFGHNSTIAIKEKICVRCGKPCVWFSKKRCQSCAKLEDTFKRMEAANESEISEEGLTELINQADEVFSKYVRLAAADKEGIVSCYICDKKVHWKEAENMHYIKRGASLFLRYDLRNNRAGCNECNCVKGGNYGEYAKRLDAEHPGITDILFEEGALYVKMTREEIRTVINEYTPKVKQLLTKLNSK